MTVTGRSAATPTHGPERAFRIVFRGLAPLLGLMFSIGACSDGFSPVTLETTASNAAAVPDAVSDLSAEEETDTSATLTWTEVDDGEDAPASYEVRYSSSPTDDWSEASTVEDGSCAAPVEGDRVGAPLSCDAEALAPGESYDFRVAAFRLDEDGSRIYSPEPSNTATVELTISATGEDGGGGSTDDGGSDGGGSTDDGSSSDGGSSSDDGSSGKDDGSSGGSSDEEDRYPNRPDELSTLTEISYEKPDEDGWRTRDDDDFSIVSNPDAPRSPSEVGEARFPAGLGDGKSPIASTATVSDAESRRLYLSYWVKLSDNWQGHPSKVNKIGFAWTHGKPVAILNVHGTGQGRLGSEIRLQDIPDGARNLEPNVTDPDIVRGEWHRWEVLLVSNSGDASDGEVHWWIDGQKAGEHRDVRFGTSSDPKIWEYVSWRPYWGGRGGTVEETMYMWMDHFYVAGER